MLIVTCYYNIPSKASSSFYYENIARYFRYIKVPILFFTDEDNHSQLKALAGDNVTFHIQPFEQMNIFKEFPIDFWKDQITKDPEKYHTWQVGALWCNKSGFVKQATEICPHHEWYMWVDAGSLRRDDWAPFMNEFGNRPLPETPGVYVQQLRDIPPNYLYFGYPFYAIVGSHILFHKDYIDEFISKYHDMIHEYERANISLIDDQNMKNSMVSQKKMDRLFTIRCNISCPDEFFFFYCIF